MKKTSTFLKHLKKLVLKVQKRKYFGNFFSLSQSIPKYRMFSIWKFLFKNDIHCLKITTLIKVNFCSSPICSANIFLYINILENKNWLLRHYFYSTQLYFLSSKCLLFSLLRFFFQNLFNLMFWCVCTNLCKCMLSGPNNVAKGAPMGLTPHNKMKQYNYNLNKFKWSETIKLIKHIHKCIIIKCKASAISCWVLQSSKLDALQK